MDTLHFNPIALKSQNATINKEYTLQAYYSVFCLDYSDFKRYKNTLKIEKYGHSKLQFNWTF